MMLTPMGKTPYLDSTNLDDSLPSVIKSSYPGREPDALLSHEGQH
jgi:hypothetical protein